MPVISPFLAICAALTEAQGHGTAWRCQCSFRSLFSKDRPIDWSASQGLFRGSVCKQEKSQGLLRHPWPSHSRRQRRRHQGFSAFPQTQCLGVVIPTYSKNRGCNPNKCRIIPLFSGLRQRWKEIVPCLKTNENSRSGSIRRRWS